MKILSIFFSISASRVVERKSGVALRQEEEICVRRVETCEIDVHENEE